MRRVNEGPELRDDLPLDPLAQGLREQIEVLRSEKKATISAMRFGEASISKEDYIEGLEHLLELHRDSRTKEHFLQRVKRDFDFHEVYGGASWGEVMVTSYYEPVIPGAARRTSRFTKPLLTLPQDWVEIDLATYGEKFRDMGPVMRGRLLPERSEAGYHQVVPFFTRAEIESGALKGRRLELVWVDPIDGFFLEIQGSGTVLLPGGKRLRVGYASQNGQSYESIGRYLVDVIPKEQMTLQTIEAYLRTLPAPEAQGILEKNPSYVFFRKLDGKPMTFFGTSVVDGRTIATDARFFPKGALAYLEFDAPRFAAPDAHEPAEWKRTGRLVVDTDKGGAIKGGGRVDLYWGSGPEARQHAGVMKSEGRLYYLAPKAVMLAQRRLRKEQSRPGKP
ncbi:MAG: MltA domain-containing protein [Bdellovibrionales bacterium]|nr:MltA domain-containing protein [Bdellovibrionales bacterium]